MLTFCIVIFFGLSGSRAQSYYDVTTQGIIPWNGGAFNWDEATCNIGQFVAAPAPSNIRLVGNSAEQVATTTNLNALTGDPDQDGDHGNESENIAVACNHNSNVAAVYIAAGAPDGDGVSLTMNVVLLSNTAANGMINMAGAVMNSTLPSPQVSWNIPNDCDGNVPDMGGISAAMDDQFLYISYLYEPCTGGWEIYYAVVSLGDCPTDCPHLVTGPILVTQPGSSSPAITTAKATVTCNRWQHSTGNAMIAFVYQNSLGRSQPATVVPDAGPSSAANIVEPTIPTNCYWVRVVDFDNQSGTPQRHFFYAYQYASHGAVELFSTDNSTVWGPITTNLVLYTWNGATVPSPGVGDGYLNQSVYCDFVENATGGGGQNLRICRQEGDNNIVVVNTGSVSSFMLGCNQMGIFIPYDDGAQHMWRAFWPFASDIAENTLATGLCKVNPNANPTIQGIGVGTPTNLDDTLRVFHESEISPSQQFLFANSNPITTPPVLWAGEHPSASVDADPGNARGDIILDLSSDVDFGGSLDPPPIGATLMARSDGSIEYNGALFEHENADLIGCEGETRVKDSSINRRGIWYMNYQLSFVYAWFCDGTAPSVVTFGIYNGSTFGGVKGLVRFISTDNCYPYLTISGNGSSMNFDSTEMYLGYNVNSYPAADQIVAEDAGDGNGPPNSITFTNGQISNLWQHNGYYEGDFENRPNNPGSAAAFSLDGLTNINISDNFILYTQFDITNPITSVNFNGNNTENIQNLIDLVWTNSSQFGGQININENTFGGDWPFGSGSISDASQTIIFDGITVPVSDQWMVQCDHNIFLNHSSGDVATTFYNPNSTAVFIDDGADVDVSDNFIGGYGVGIDNVIVNLAYSFYCNNFIFQSDACPPRGVGILEEGSEPGAVFPKLNTTADLAVGYWVKGNTASTPVANQFGSNNSAFMLRYGYGPYGLLVEIGPLLSGTEPGTIGAEFQDYAATILYGSHTGPDNFAGFNQFAGNTEAQVKFVDDGDQDAQPYFGLLNNHSYPHPCTGESMTGVYGENVFTAPSGAVQFECPNVVTPPYQLYYALTENQWNPTIENYPTDCWHFNSGDSHMPSMSYNDIGDGTATGSFVCGGSYSTKHGKNISLSIQDNTNPYDPSDTEWLYFEALPWIGVNNQFALDTMRLFVERFPMYRPLIPAALNYTGQIVADMADTGKYVVTQDWIDQYNWLVSIYTADTAAWYETRILFAMSGAEDYFNRNETVNLLWNMERLFPMSYSTDSTGIASIRNYQKEIPEDTTPFHLIQMPPIPYGVNAVTPSIAQNITLSVVPNPANQTITAYINTTFSAPATLEIYDALGQRVVALPSPRLQMGTNQFNFDCTTLAAGNYFLRLATGGNVQTVQITIVH
jgi:hypothetical protein